MSRPNLRTLSTSLIALALPVTIFVGILTSAYFKKANPDNVDVTAGLAYLQYTMTAAVVTFALFVIAAVVAIVLMYKRDRDFHNAKLPLTLLVLVVLFTIGFILTNQYINQVQDQYLTDHGRPTLQQYFDAVDKQKSQ